MRTRLIVGLVSMLVLGSYADRCFAGDACSTSEVVGVVRADRGPVRALVVALRQPDSEVVGWAGSGLRALMCMSALVLPPVDASETPAAVTRADDDGRFRLPGLAPGNYRLGATTPQGAAGGVEIWIPVPGAVIEQDIEVGSPVRAVVCGRIRHADGRPFRGRVAPLPIGMVIRAAAPGVETDACGRFRLRLDLPATGLRGVWIGAIVPERSVVLWPLDGRKGPLDLVVDEGVRTVQGSVVEEGSGRPVAGAEVYLCGGDGTNAIRRFERATTGEGGAFRLTLVGPGSRGVFVRSDGHGQAWAQVHELGDSVSVPPLPLAGRIRGRVVWPDMGAARTKDLRVWAWLQFNVDGSGPGVAGTTPDAAGHFDLGPVGPCSGIIYAAGGGWISHGVSEWVGGRAEILPHVAVHAGETVDVDVQLVRAGTVRGRVTGPDGMPVVGALVRVDIVHGTGQPIGSRPPGTEPTMRHAATGADGTYAISSLIPGVPYAVEVAAPGLATAASDVARAGSGDSVTIDFRLDPARDLSVTVLDAATGGRVAEASVYLSHRLRSGSSMHGGACDTDRFGRCRFRRLRAEPIEITVHAEGHRSVTRTIARRERGGAAHAEIRLDR